MRETAVLDRTIYQQAPEGCAADNASPSLEQLEAELADARLLHRLSIQLIQEDGTAGLYKKIVEAAVAIMRSQYASMQMLYPEPGSIGKLRLLASSGFSPEAEKFWEWVYRHTGSSCGAALRAQQRVVIPNFATCEFMQTAPTLPIFLEAGIFAAQSTPLYSRGGRLLGMISTHWNHPHNPPQRLLDLMDILARQAADLIERTQTAEALRESEERLRALTTATNDVLYRMNADWTSMIRLDGRDFLNDTGEPVTDWMEKYIFPGDREMVLSAVGHAVRTKSVFQLEHRVIKADGTPGWTFSRAVPIMDRNGAVIEWFGAASDITDKKSLLTRLEAMVNERTRELQRSNDDLQQFAHVASHDLKEPVRKIRTFGLRLRNEMGECLNENTRLYTEKILESASRMSTMIEGVLTYSSLNAIEQKIERLDLNRLIGDICNDLEVLIEQKGAVIRYEALPVIDGVQVLIYQLFYNLINNSLKFSTETGKPLVTITAGTIYEEGVPYAEIEVADNGIGFDPAQNEMIFDTFTRLHSKTRYDGTGLGLSLCRKIVERHKGRIRAEGAKNAGARFTILLPSRQTQ
ncbi:MAG TPA: ATP-binding protein [Puia sp.]|nr:ATP-binding protein [Puia sp.]